MYLYYVKVLNFTAYEESFVKRKMQQTSDIMHRFLRDY